MERLDLSQDIIDDYLEEKNMKFWEGFFLGTVITSVIIAVSLAGVAYVLI